MGARVKDIIKIMENYFPRYLAEDWDNVGLQIGSYNNDVTKILICLDIDEEIVKQAVDNKVNMIITHHPLFFKPIKFINFDHPQGSFIKRLIQANICVYSAHTNMDAGERGINQVLAELLGLVDIQPLDKAKKQDYFKLVVFVPVTHVEEVRKAINDAGAGYIGGYSDCSFRLKGTGTFKPLPGTNPYIGQIERLEEVEEYRLETIIAEQDINRVLHNMIKVHPYEEVAYDLYPLANQGKIFSLGRKGRLPAPISLKNFADNIKRALNIDSLSVVGDLTRKVNKVAVVSGSGASFINIAKAQKIDVLVTGDLKYHEAKDADMIGLSVIDAGHQATEEIMTSYLNNLLEREFTRNNYEIQILTAYAEKCIKIY